MDRVGADADVRQQRAGVDLVLVGLVGVGVHVHDHRAVEGVQATAGELGDGLCVGLVVLRAQFGGVKARGAQQVAVAKLHVDGAAA